MSSMPLYEIANDSFRSIAEASFIDWKLQERGGLQRLLLKQIDVLGDELYVLTEEFSDWEDSRRRIDLLAIDKRANLVVIELKRTADGGHMDLQAIRYASMVSAMTFARAAQIHSEFLSRLDGNGSNAQERILQFLNWDEPNEEEFAADVRIILVSEDFGKEVTTAVLWLRDYDIDIRCVRLRPYQNGPTRMIDVQQIIPLPEANDYQVQLREKEQEERKERVERRDLRHHFWEGLIGVARSRKTRHANIKPGSYSWLGASSGKRGLGFNFSIAREHGQVELYIDRGEEAENKRIFDQLHSQREAIEQSFGASLVWERLEGKQASRIKFIVPSGGWRSPETQWPKVQTEMVDAMTKLEGALKQSLESLTM
jgi:hypothetical protein